MARARATVTALVALLASGLAVACGVSENGAGSPGNAAPPPAAEDAGSAASGNDTVDAGTSIPSDAGDLADARPPVVVVDAAPDAAPIATCGSTASISAILAQYGSDSTASTVTPMGTRFEAAAKAGPISSANAAFLATASSNPDVAQATSATGLVWQAVNVKLYPSAMPSPEDISQHAIGDCDGDSALASLAYVNPAFVRSLITDVGDGTYRVAMFDPRGEPITVAVDAQVLVDTGGTSLGQVSASDGSADWATILEKAVMKYDVAYGMVGQLDGIGSETMVPMFTGTGGSIAISPGSLTPEQFQRVVTLSLAAGKLITGGFTQALSLGEDETVTAHGYAVMVPSDSSVDMVDMRNPWGVNPWASASTSGYDTSTDGLLQIPLATSAVNWPTIVDLRIIDPVAQCAGVTAPFVPQMKRARAPVHVREAHARR